MLITLRKLYGIAAHIQFLAFQKGVHAHEVNNHTHKRIIYGSGGAKPENAVQIARAWGFPAKNDDEADACGVFLYALSQRFPSDFNKKLTLRGNSKHVVQIIRPNKRKKSTTCTKKKSKRTKPQNKLL